ncbi:MAG: type II secretion system F family protein [Elusimicrobia bacterium]|nr:type II secretion system F family protein [Elusimicrobiota bacterium]
MSNNELSLKPLRFYHALAEASQAGLSLLAGVEAASRDGTLSEEVALNLRSRLRRGESLAGAMARFPETFPAWQSAIVRMGETSGRLDLAFVGIGEILERRRAYWLRVMSRLAAPLFILHLAPLILSMPLWVSAGFDAYLRAVLKALAPLDLAILALWFGWPRLQFTAPAVRLRRFDAKLRFCLCLTALVKAGISLTEAVGISCLAADRPPPAQDWEKRQTLVERLTEVGVFSQEELGLLRVAEYSGSVDIALASIAENAGRSLPSLGLY